MIFFFFFHNGFVNFLNGFVDLLNGFLNFLCFVNLINVFVRLFNGGQRGQRRREAAGEGGARLRRGGR